MKTIIAIGGFARAGKTTSLQILRDKLGIASFSTSVLLDQFINSLSRELNVSIPEAVEDRRKHKIQCAEGVLVPVFGREIFCQRVAHLAMTYDDDIVAIETIGGEEWNIIQSLILFHAAQSGASVRIVRINIRSDSEIGGVDIRQLLKCSAEIWNDGTLDDLRQNWYLTLESLGVL